MILVKLPHVELLSPLPPPPNNLAWAGELNMGKNKIKNAQNGLKMIPSAEPDGALKKRPNGKQMAGLPRSNPAPNTRT